MSFPYVLLTGFRPFDGRTLNGTETIARQLHGHFVNGHRIESRLINVVWDDVSRFCATTLANSSASLVLCLGEADRPKPCFELLGKEHASGLDVRGNEPQDCSGGRQRKTRLAFSHSWFDDPETLPVESTDAGEYLCNWLLFNGVARSPAPLGFLHLPVQGATPDDEYSKKFLPVVKRLIQGNLASDSPD